MPIDYKKYSEDWKDIIRPKVLERAGYKCEVCKVRQRAKGYRDKKGVFVECDNFMLNWAKKQGFKVITIYLQVAHLDHNINNNSPVNLKAMCQKCHLNYDKELHRINRIGKKYNRIF